MELDELLETLRRIEALHARTDVPGERQAAAAALEVMRARLARLVQQDPPVEFRFTMSDDWSRRLFTALLRRYGIQPYRYGGQRRTTVMARVSNHSWTRRCGRSSSSEQRAAEVPFRCDRSRHSPSHLRRQFGSRGTPADGGDRRCTAAQLA